MSVPKANKISGNNKRSSDTDLGATVPVLGAAGPHLESSVRSVSNRAVVQVECVQKGKQRVKGLEIMSEGKELPEWEYLASQKEGLGEPVVAVLKYRRSCHLAEIGHVL